MSSKPLPSTRDLYSTMREMRWSPKEKAIARRAFDDALNQELKATIQEAKQMAARIAEPDDLWKLERHLTQRRKEIDAKYEYKYSIILLVLGDLLHEGRISLDNLRGLTEDKLCCVRDHRRRSGGMS